MRWKKLGKIFTPSEHELSNDCKDFAQSPQTLVFKDFVRIYFSTRKKDEQNGKYCSHISFVDMDKRLEKILNVSKHAVIGLGELGCFDEHGIFPINPVQVGDKILAYTCGWSRRQSVSVETSIGLAISYNNGMTFIKQGMGPVMSSSLHEPFLVGDAFVRFYNERYYMWYIFGTTWIETETEGPARVYKIGQASSPDGINWTKDEKRIIRDKLNESECQALPTVIFNKGIYFMFFCYRHATDFRTNPERSYRIGHAHSVDLVQWTRNDEAVGIDVSEEGWDSQMICYPHVFECDERIYLLYNGNEFGKFGFGAALLEE